MKRYLASFLAACISCLTLPVVHGVSAAPSAPRLVPEGEKFLFIVDMSSGMERLKEGIETTIYELLRTGLFGQMQTGDTYGLWTFDKETHAEKVPMQVWDARRASQLGTIAAAYLSDHHYENSDDVKQMTGLLTTVVQSARNLNVFIISDGSSAMRGTPFDKAINTDYRKQRRSRSAAKLPFVTTLIARDGSLTNYSVVIGGQPIILPKRAVPVVAVATNAAPPTNRPAGIILAVTPVTPGTPTVATATNLQTQATPVPAPAVATIAPPVNAVAKSEARGSRVIQIVTKSNNVPAEVQSGAAEPARTSVALVSDATSTNATPPELSAPAPTPPAPASGAVPRAVSVLEAVLPAPVTVAARELHPEPAPPAAVQAAALPVPSGPGAGLFLAFGSLLMAMAFFLLFVVFRRLRPAPGASLITQSMERR
jgi:hypothetical protein